MRWFVAKYTFDHSPEKIDCEELKFKRRLCKTRDEYESIKRESANHRHYIMKLRQIYQEPCEKARHDECFAVIAFDGSDQLSTQEQMHWRKSDRRENTALRNLWVEYSSSKFVSQKLQLCLVLNGVPDKLRFCCFNPLVGILELNSL